jgi:uncharacterized paraquat-inducible protein A
MTIPAAETFTIVRTRSLRLPVFPTYFHAMVPTSQSTHEPPDSRTSERSRKAVLVCQACDYENPPDGDWVLRTVGSREVRRCPRCKSVVERRPVFDRHHRKHAVSTAPTAALRSATSLVVSGWQRAAASARALTTAPLRR